MKVYFKEDTHQYFNEEGKQYISVSALAKKLEAPKNWDKIKRKYAKKHNLNLKEVSDIWEKKRKLGTEAGTIYHSDREQQLLAEGESLHNNIKCNKKSCEFSNGLKWSIPIEELEDNTIYPELIIYDHKTGICGQSDKVIIANGVIHVQDYKTDKSIDREAFKSEWVTPEKLLPPVEQLDNCNYNLYSLKMSMYMYMLWNANKKYRTGKIILEHVQLERDEEGIPILKDQKPIVKSIEMIEVPFRRTEVKKIFEAYKNGKL